MAKVYSLIAGLCFSLLVVPQIQAQELRFYYCYATNHADGAVFVSETAPVGPVEERRRYSARLVENLIARNMVPPQTRGYCVMRTTESEIEKGKLDLRTSCEECGQAKNFRNVEFAGGLPASDHANSGATESGDRSKRNPATVSTEDKSQTPVMAANVLTGTQPTGDSTAPSSKGAEKIPFEIAAALPHSVYIRLIPRYDEAFVQVHYRFFLCGEEIYVSYSLRPVPKRGVNQIRLSAAVSGNFMDTKNFVSTAKMVPGHRLGCASQRHKIANLSEFESQLISGRFTDGTVMWSRSEKIKHLLAGFSMYAPAAPWPPGSH